jgi:ELWxxDGT repeat protein
MTRSGRRHLAIAIVTTVLGFGRAEAAPPHLLADINPGPAASYPGSFTAVGSELFFAARTAAAGAELWKTDGTAAGTTQVADLLPGTGSSFPESLTVAGGTLYFLARDVANIRQLWRSDGTMPGTTQLSAFAGYDDAAPMAMVASSGKVYFTVTTFGTHPQIWTSDGTPAGTQRIGDGTTLAFDGVMADAGGTLFFAALDASGIPGVWKSDGTPAGTVRLATFPATVHLCAPPTFCYDYHPLPSSLVDFGGTLYFAAYEGGAVPGIYLWRSDGTPAGTARVALLGHDYVFGGPPTVADAPAVVVGGTLFIDGEGRNHSVALWKSDGTPAGTVRVVDTDVGPGTPYPMANVGGTLFLVAGEQNFTQDLWKSDGTAAGTIRLTSTSHQNLYALADVAGTAYFVASTYPTVELWRSDGTPAGTAAVTDAPNALAAATAGGYLFFNASVPCTGAEVWTTAPGSGVPSGTCGDGVVDAGEDCDEGIEHNGTSGSCCTCACTFAAAGTSCQTGSASCPVTASCSGTAGACPPSASTCGDGVVDAGEACDEDAANGTPSSCCTCGCTFQPATTVCRPSAAACDVAESCTGAAGACPPDAPPADADGDGVCDGHDPCTNVAGTVLQGARLEFGRLDTRTYDDRVRVRGQFPASAPSPVDPLARGVRLLVHGAPGTPSLDLTIPGGAYDRIFRRGWKVNRSATTWTYTDGGTRRAKVRRLASTGDLAVDVRDGTGNYLGATAPFAITVVLDTPTATTGQCAEATLAANRCVSSTKRHTISCE